MKQAFNILISLAAILAISGCSHQSSEEAAEAQRVKSTAEGMQKHGIMSSDDWVNFDRLDKLSGAERSLSDKDFALLLKLMEAHQGRMNISPSKPVVIVHLAALDIFTHLTRATPEQKRRIVSSTSLLLNSPNPQEATVAKRVMDEFRGSY